jgi:hypothetical protein
MVTVPACPAPRMMAQKCWDVNLIFIGAGAWREVAALEFPTTTSAIIAVRCIDQYAAGATRGRVDDETKPPEASLREVTDS